jgi:3-deoxy-D-manno-octulosonate 8-phosphate phosphatase (KDO 8-P phosphatase)
MREGSGPGSAAERLSFADRCRRIELLLLDVDGVLTDGRIIYGDEGGEIKSFHVRDGSGLKLWQMAGKQSALITGRRSAVVAIRAAELGMGYVFQGVADKRVAWEQLLAQSGVPAEQICCVGDDLPDLPLLRRCGLAVAVADACAEVRAAAHYVTQVPGGRGAVREIIEWLLRSQGRWEELVRQLA